MLELAYSTTSRDTHQEAWAAFDRLVAWADRTRPGGTVDDIAQILPAGIHLPLIAETLNRVRQAPPALNAA